MKNFIFCAVVYVAHIMWHKIIWRNPDRRTQRENVARKIPYVAVFGYFVTRFSKA